MSARPESPRWLLLIHQLPKEPAYLRVKIGRRLARVGAIALKSSVYVLPMRDGAAEDFEWVRNEILAGGGEATVVEAHLVSGLSDDEIESKFREAKDAEYDELLREAEALEVEPRGRRKRPLTDEERTAALAVLRRIAQRIEEIAATDFFDAPTRGVLTTRLRELEAKLEPRAAEMPDTPSIMSVEARTWVTRAGIHVDRIASAWLIRRSIDPKATFKFVPANAYTRAEGELRFDMFEAEYSHEGDACTFETLLARFGLEEAGLRGVAEVVHDIDIKDEKFGRPETAGIAACIAGVCRSSATDEERLARGSIIFDGLLAHFAAKNSPPR